MADRFLFRTLFSITFHKEDDAGKEYEYTKDALIYGVAVYGANESGVAIDDFIDQLKKGGFTDDEIREIENDSEPGNAAIYDGIGWVYIDGTVEQCTGWRDMKGTPIYEGDILYKPFSNLFKIEWDHEDARFVAVFSDHKEDLSDQCEKQIEIFGNIHDV